MIASKKIASETVCTGREQFGSRNDHSLVLRGAENDETDVAMCNQALLNSASQMLRAGKTTISRLLKKTDINCSVRRYCLFQKLFLS